MRDGQVDRPGVLAAFVPLAAAALVWWPVTGTYFHLDDLVNLYNLVNMPVRDFLTRMHGGHLLTTCNLVFLLHHRLFGLRAEFYMGAMWLTHLLNVVLVYAVLHRMTASRGLACFGATLWGTSAINEGALNWYAVYGQVLALTAVLLVLLGLLRRETSGDTRWWPVLPWLALLAAASSSFGTGLGMTLVMPLVALLWLPPSPGRRRVVVLLALVAAAMAVLYLILRPADIAAHGGQAPGALLRMAYRSWPVVAAFFIELLACGATSLLLGTWYRADLYVRPVAVGMLTAAAVVLLVGLWRAPARARRHAIGAVVLAASAYALIAIGRFYAAGKGVLIVAAARYHYAAPALLVIALCTGLAGVAPARWLSAGWRRVLLSAWFALAALGYTRSVPINHFDGARLETAQTMSAIAAAVEAAPPGADVYLPFQTFRGVGAMVARFPRIFPGNAAIFAIFSPTDTMDGRRVFFIAPNPIVYANTRTGLRAPTLIVAPARP